jgi:hypothetical protein
MQCPNFHDPRITLLAIIVIEIRLYQEWPSVELALIIADKVVGVTNTLSSAYSFARYKPAPRRYTFENLRLLQRSLQWRSDRVSAFSVVGKLHAHD